MLRLRACVLSHISSSPSTSHIFALRRFLSATAPAQLISRNQAFAVEDYLVHTCGLTRAQALKASTKLSHLKSPANPDAVVAFLAGLGLSGADVAAAVVNDPRLLCASVERTLAPVVCGLTGLGLSNPEIARLVPIARDRFRFRSIVSKLQYYMPLFVSSENLIRALKFNTNLLRSSLDKVVQPNLLLLRECGLSDSDIIKLTPRMLTTNPARSRAMVACAEGLGVPRGSGMFKQALHAVSFESEEKIAAKIDYLKNTFTWSDAEVAIVVCKAPMVLSRSKESLQRIFNFLITELGMETSCIARCPFLILCSLEGRLKPRHYVVKFLKENGLLNRNWSYSSIVTVGERGFVEKFIRPHKDAAPHLAEDYLAACRGEVPARFMFA